MASSTSPTNDRCRAIADFAQSSLRGRPEAFGHLDGARMGTVPASCGRLGDEIKAETDQRLDDQAGWQEHLPVVREATAARTASRRRRCPSCWTNHRRRTRRAARRMVSSVGRGFREFVVDHRPDPADHSSAWINASIVSSRIWSGLLPARVAASGTCVQSRRSRCMSAARSLDAPTDLAISTASRVALNARSASPVRSQWWAAAIRPKSLSGEDASASSSRAHR